MDDEIFDDDQALEVIFLDQDVKNKDGAKKSNSGCLGLVIIIITPVALFSISSFVELV